jgi:HPt (histidine-containing phosphotransfer) domain-containing protein
MAGCTEAVFLILNQTEIVNKLQMASDTIIPESLTDDNITDLRFLEKLANGDVIFIKTIVSVFLEENPKEIRTLEKGIEAGDFMLIKTAAHKLKSTVPYIGLGKIIEKQIADIEKLAAANEEITKIESLFLEVKNICEKAQKELSRAYK